MKENKVIKSLETLCEGIFSFSKDAVRAGVLLVIIAGVWFAGRNYEKNKYYPEIAEISNVNDSVLVINDKYRLDYNPDLSSDPNKIVFTSYKYQNNGK